MQAIQVCYQVNEDNKKREIDGLTEALEKFGLTNGLIITFDQKNKLKIGGNRNSNFCLAVADKKC